MTTVSWHQVQDTKTVHKHEICNESQQSLAILNQRNSNSLLKMSHHRDLRMFRSWNAHNLHNFLCFYHINPLAAVYLITAPFHLSQLLLIFLLFTIFIVCFTIPFHLFFIHIAPLLLSLTFLYFVGSLLLSSFVVFSQNSNFFVVFLLHSSLFCTLFLFSL